MNGREEEMGNLCIECVCRTTDPHHKTELWRYFNMTHDDMVYDEGVFKDILSATVKIARN